MRKVSISFEVFVTQSNDGVSMPNNPDYVFCGEFDKDDDVSFSKMCDLEYKVEKLAELFISLDCKVSVLKNVITRIV